MIEAIVQTLLSVPAVSAAVGDSIALQQLPQGSSYPAIVYQVVSSTTMQRLCSPSIAYSSRVQVNPLANTMGQVNGLHDLAKAALQSDIERTVGSLRVVSCRLTGYGPATKDEFTGMWTKPADYILIHE